MNRTLLRCLTAASVLYILLMPFPFLPGLNILLTHMVEQSDLSSLSFPLLALQFLFCLGAGLAGYALGWLYDDKLQLSAFQRKMASLPVLLLLTSGAFFTLFRQHSLYLAIVTAVLTAVYFCLCQYSYFFLYADILCWKQYYVTLAFYVGVLLFLAVFLENPYGVMLFAILFLIETMLLLFGLNQSSIDYMMQRRKHRMDSLPHRIRSYNLMLLGGLILLIVVLFLLQKPIGSFLGWIGSILFTGLKFILRLLFSPSNQNEDTDTPESPSKPDSDPSGSGGEESGGSWIPIVLWIVLIGIIVGLIWTYRREIRNAFHTVVRKIAAFFRHLLFSGHTRSHEDTTAFYSDVDESVLPGEEIASLEDEAALLNWRKWRKSYRQFSGMEDSPEKFRFGYQLMIRWLRIQEVDVRCSHTPLEICRLSREKSRFFPDLSDTTQQYNELRYGELTFNISSMTGLKNALHTMSQLKAAR